MKNSVISSEIRRWLIYFAIVVTLSIVINTVVAPYIRLLVNRIQINQAKDQWLSNKPSAYQVTVWQRGFIDEPDACRNIGDGYIITVINGEITASNAPVQCKMVYEQLTIDNGFDWLDQALREANPILAAAPTFEIDSANHLITYFYISQAETMSSSNPSEWHDKRISYDNFKILNPQSK
jgi:hypothetical protein